MSEASSFRPPTRDVETAKRSIQEPQCIIDLPVQDFSKMALTPDQLLIAKEELITKDFTALEFPKTMKLYTDPPMQGQVYSLLSFIPSKLAKPDPQGCYGVLKMRGNFPNEQQSEAWAEHIIRTHDSYAVIDICYTGKPFPLMHNNEIYRGVTREVDIRRKINEVQKDDLKTKRDNDKLEMQDIQERHRNLMRSVEEDKDDSIDDLELYTQLRTKKAHLMYNSDELARKIKDSVDLIKKAGDEITAMDNKNPEYKDEFLQKYKDALASTGISEDSNPLIKYMNE
jgi:hypothetical protein